MHGPSILFVVDVNSMTDGLGSNQVTAGCINWKITNRGAIPIDSGRDITGLSPGLVRHEYPKGETSKQVNFFINRFMAVKGGFPPSEF